MDIEQLATSAIVASVSKTDRLRCSINSVDKEPCWDGCIYIYEDAKCSKAGIRRVATQVKGKLVPAGEEKDTVKYAVSYDDLSAYMRDGGTLFFVVYLDNTTGNTIRIYFAELLPSSIKKLLNVKQGSYRIAFRSFPEENTQKITLLEGFYDKMRQESGAAGAELPAIAERAEDCAPRHFMQIPEPLSPKYYINDTLSWLKECAENETSAICLYGPPGSGKTSLLFHFLQRMEPEGEVLYWQFQNNTSEFFAAAMGYCGGDAQMQDDLVWANRFCDKFSRGKDILILNGIQTIQSGDGGIQNPVMKSMIKRLAKEVRGGLVVLLSTNPVKELEYYDHARNKQMPKLMEEHGIALLREQGLQSEERQLRSIVKGCDYNPLALILYARLMRYRRNDSCREVDFMKILDGSNQTEGEALQRVISGYREIWPEHSDAHVLLSLASLFKNEFTLESLERLVGQCDGAEQLRKLSQSDRMEWMAEFVSFGVLSKMEAQPVQYRFLPTMRDYYAKQFRENHLESYLKCNVLLADDILRNFKDEYVMRIIHMEPLYHAVYYLTRAQEYDRALDVFWGRICRERQFFSQKVLGAFSNDLDAASLFFCDDRDWEPVPQLSKSNAAWVCASAAYLFGITGALRQAEKLRRKAISIYQELNHKTWMATNLQHLGSILMLRGKLGEASRVFDEANQILEALQKEPEAPVDRYAQTLRPEKWLANNRVRRAYLAGMREEMGELSDISEAVVHSCGKGAVYYYTLRLEGSKTAEEKARVKDGINRYFHQHKDDDRPHRRAYAYLLHAFAQFPEKKALALDDLKKAVECSRQINRADQYTFVLLNACRLCLKMWKKTRKSPMKDRILGDYLSYSQELTRTLEIYDIPLFAYEHGILRLEYAVARNDGQEADALRDRLERNGEMHHFFRGKILQMEQKGKE